MRILHLGSSELGLGVLEVLRRVEADEILHTDDLRQARVHLASKDIDWIVSAGFRHILKQEDLDRARDSCNVHLSLLPWGKGANPNVWVLAAGEPGGVSLHRMVARVDEGPLFAQREIETALSDTAQSVYGRLRDAAVSLFEEEWERIRSGELQPGPQPAGGSYHRVSDMERLKEIDLAKPATYGEVINVLRALTFPPHRNAIVEVDDRRYQLEIKIEVIDDV